MPILRSCNIQKFEHAGNEMHKMYVTTIVNIQHDGSDIELVNISFDKVDFPLLKSYKLDDKRSVYYDSIDLMKLPKHIKMNAGVFYKSGWNEIDKENGFYEIEINEDQTNKLFNCDYFSKLEYVEKESYQIFNIYSTIRSSFINKNITKVHIVYTFDNWNTTLHHTSSRKRPEIIDEVMFIKSSIYSHTEQNSIIFCLSFIDENGNEFWDNNNGQNYNIML